MRIDEKRNTTLFVILGPRAYAQYEAFRCVRGDKPKRIAPFFLG